MMQVNILDGNDQFATPVDAQATLAWRLLQLIAKRYGDAEFQAARDWQRVREDLWSSRTFVLEHVRIGTVQRAMFEDEFELFRKMLLEWTDDEKTHR